MNDPMVSVVIPFYAGVSWLEEALKSVNNQEYKNLEVLVINDGSKEDISFLITKYKKEVRFINKENGGPASARNEGINLSKGEYIAFLDSDDIWHPEKLVKQIKYMEDNNYVWSHHSYEMFWDKKDKTKIIHTEKLKGNVLKDTYISFKAQTSCIVVRKASLLDNDIKFPTDKRYGQDMIFFRELARHYSLGYVEGVLSKFRIRGSNAGFRAKIQLADKADTWDVIKSDKNLLYVLPTNVILAYIIARLFNSIIMCINNRVVSKESVIEIFSKGLYLLPYMLFKINFKK